MSETDLEILCRTLQCQQLPSYTYSTHNPFYSFDLEPTSVSSSSAKSEWLLRFETAHSVLELSFQLAEAELRILNYAGQYYDAVCRVKMKFW